MALFANGEAKLGVASVSLPPFVLASWPMPEAANAFQMMSWLAPPNRTRSAASMLSRMSSIDTALADWSRNESNISWIQRRLPGQACTSVRPSAQDSCSDGVPWPYRLTKAWRTRKFVADQISPSACTSGPTRSKPRSE